MVRDTSCLGWSFFCPPMVGWWQGVGPPSPRRIVWDGRPTSPGFSQSLSGQRYHRGSWCDGAQPDLLQRQHADQPGEGEDEPLWIYLGKELESDVAGQDFVFFRWRLCFESRSWYINQVLNGEGGPSLWHKQLGYNHSCDRWGSSHLSRMLSHIHLHSRNQPERGILHSHAQSLRFLSPKLNLMLQDFGQTATQSDLCKPKQ